MIIPNPGSNEAIEQGCLCPVIDNNHGQGIWISDEKCFWRNAECPLHGEVKDERTEQQNNS